MLRYMYGKRTFRFLESDAGGGGGGDAGGQQQQTPPKVETPFDNIAWDELDDQTKTALEKAKTEYVATLQRESKLKVDLEHQAGLSRQFQSAADRNKAELDRLTGGAKKDDPNPLLAVVQTQLKNLGYKDDDITKIAPAWAKMLEDAGNIQRTQLGRDLAPLATTVLASAATNAFEEARSQGSDPLGYLQDNDVAEKVWAVVQDRVAKGQETSAAIVTNLARMAWAESMEEKALKGEEIKLPTPRMSTTPPGMTPPRFSFPGAGSNGMTPAIPPMRDSNAARTTLDPDTQAALAQTFSYVEQATGLSPKAFKKGGKK